MTPEYLEELANLADPDQLWRLGIASQAALTPAQQKQMDTGVVLRRYASHVRRLHALCGTGKSLVITPLGLNGTAVLTMQTPPRHQQLLDIRKKIGL